MALCVRRLAEIGGGIVVVEDGAVRAELPLPVAGLMSDRPAERGGGAARRLHARCWREHRRPLSRAPFMTLSFLGLSVIPSLKITDHGLIDVDRFEIVPLEAEVAPRGPGPARRAVGAVGGDVGGDIVLHGVEPLHVAREVLRQRHGRGVICLGVDHDDVVEHRGGIGCCDRPPAARVHNRRRHAAEQCDGPGHHLEEH